MSSHEKSNNFISRILSTMTGYRKATAEDLLKLHKSGDFHLEEYTLKFLEQLKNQQSSYQITGCLCIEET